jgi:hypothetical protein
MKNKKILLTIILFFLLFNHVSVFAKESVKESIVSSKSAAVEYMLPYPGLLPDNPLFFFRAIRDSVTRFFISDSLKKAEYDLLQADKKINTVYFLSFKRNIKDKMLISTLLESQKHFEYAIKEVTLAREQGADTAGILERMLLSARKQQEILLGLKSKILLNNKQEIEKGIKKAQNFEKLVEEIKPK